MFMILGGIRSDSPETITSRRLFTFSLATVELKTEVTQETQNTHIHIKPLTQSNHPGNLFLQTY